MKIISKSLFIAIIAVLGFSMVSCENENIGADLMKASELEASTNGLNASQVVNEGLIQTRARSTWDKFLFLDLNNYSHIIEESNDFGLCGPLTYVLGKHFIDPTYPLTKEKAREVNKNCGYSVTPYTLWIESGQNYNTFFSKKAGNNLWGSSRQKMKEFIYNQLSKGNPILIPCIYNMATSPHSQNANHFYLIVGLMLRHNEGDNDYTYGGTGSLVLVKDVWRGGKSDEECEKTLIFNYSHLLSSVWYATQRNYSTNNNYTIRTGSESYSALALTK